MFEKKMAIESIEKESLTVPFYEGLCTIEQMADRLSQPPMHRLTHAPWQDRYPYKPDVQFAIACTNEQLFLHYAVNEKSVQAAHGQINGPVYQDSCVEAFFSFDEGDTYYNFEFNCLGTVLGAYGKGREEREWLPESGLHAISCLSTVRKGGRVPGVNWQLTAGIPLATFLHHSLPLLRRQSCRANFYKCGDRLPEPHFLCWSNIQSSQPDFHLSQFFGTLLFE